MRKACRILASVVLLAALAHSSSAVVNTNKLSVQTKEFCVQLSASLQENPPQITLAWPQDACSLPENYVIYRKAPEAASWGTGTTLPGRSTAYVDKHVLVGRAYEYQMVKKNAQYSGYGYICAGIKLPL